MTGFFQKDITSFQKWFFFSFAFIFLVLGFVMFKSDWSYKNICSHYTGWYYNNSNPLEIRFDTNDLFFNVHCNQPIEKPYTKESNILNPMFIQPQEVSETRLRKVFSELWFFVYRFIGLLAMLYISWFCVSMIAENHIITRIGEAIKWALIMFVVAVVFSIYIKFVIGWF